MRCSERRSRRWRVGSGRGEEEEEGREEGLKSQRPRRRKQAGQVARPATWPGSACQPKRERARAEGFGLGEGGVVVVVSAGGSAGVEGGGGEEGGSGDGGWRRGARFCEMVERSKLSGVEGSGGSSEAMAMREL